MKKSHQFESLESSLSNYSSTFFINLLWMNIRKTVGQNNGVKTNTPKEAGLSS